MYFVLYICNSCKYLLFLYIYIGVCHADDAYTVVSTPWIDPTMTQQDRDMQKVLMDLWISFATDK